MLGLAGAVRAHARAAHGVRADAVTGHHVVVGDGGLARGFAGVGLHVGSDTDGRAERDGTADGHRDRHDGRDPAQRPAAAGAQTAAAAQHATRPLREEREHEHHPGGDEQDRDHRARDHLVAAGASPPGRFDEQLVDGDRSEGALHPQRGAEEHGADQYEQPEARDGGASQEARASGRHPGLTASSLGRRPPGFTLFSRHSGTSLRPVYESSLGVHSSDAAGGSGARRPRPSPERVE